MKEGRGFLFFVLEEAIVSVGKNGALHVCKSLANRKREENIRLARKKRRADLFCCCFFVLFLSVKLRFKKDW